MTLTRQIMDNYERFSQHKKTRDQKIMLRRRIYQIVNEKHAIDLFIVGSSVSGLALDNSDLDMCMVFNDRKPTSYIETQVLLNEIKDLLKEAEPKRFDELIPIPAKVPLLKFKDVPSGIQIDLNIGNLVGIRNTHLLKAYADMDDRLAPLTVAVKKWAASNDINNAYRRTISSYSLTLMVIHYLQYGVTIPVLPVLQKLAPQLFSECSNIHLLRLNDPWPEWKSENKSSLAELFRGFIHYYAEVFDYDNCVASIRTGGLLSKETARNFRSPSNSQFDWNYLAIEEPYERSNAARSVHDKATFHSIKKVLRKTEELLNFGCDYKSLLKINVTHRFVPECVPVAN